MLWLLLWAQGPSALCKILSGAKTSSQHHTGKCSANANLVSKSPRSHGRKRAWRCPSSWTLAAVLSSPCPTPPPPPGEVSCSSFLTHSSEGWLVLHCSRAQHTPLPALQHLLCRKKDHVSSWIHGIPFHGQFGEKWLSSWLNQIVS